jgi:hypothetical protein
MFVVIVAKMIERALPAGKPSDSRRKQADRNSLRYQCGRLFVACDYVVLIESVGLVHPASTPKSGLMARIITG